MEWLSEGAYHPFYSVRGAGDSGASFLFLMGPLTDPFFYRSAGLRGK